MIGSCPRGSNGVRVLALPCSACAYGVYGAVGDGALLGGGRGAVVGDHAGGFQPPASMVSVVPAPPAA